MAGRRQVVNELRSSSSSTSNGSSAKTLGAAKRSSWRDKSQQFREAMKYCRET